METNHLNFPKRIVFCTCCMNIYLPVTELLVACITVMTSKSYPVFSTHRVRENVTVVKWFALIKKQD